MKKINGFLKLFLNTSLFLVLFVSVSSCSSGEKKREMERDKIWKEWGEELTEEVENSAVLLSLKYDISNRKVEEILYDYINVYNNHDYQLITTKTVNIEEWRASWDKKPPAMHDYIDNAAYRTQVSKKTVAGVILDYCFLGYQEQMDHLDSRIEDLEYEIEHYHE